MDPLSITAGVATLLKTTVLIGAELKSFHDGVSTIDFRLEGLLKDVDGLRLVLGSMRDTFATVTAEYGTGHVGSHWRNIARSLEDGQDVLFQLQEKLQAVNKTGKHLDAIRKQLRMNFATEQIAHFQLQIQSYRDTLQLSVQAVILWNQVSYQKSVEAFVPALSDLQKEIRRLALEMNRRIGSPQPDPSFQKDSKTLTNLRECVRSAASVISSASSVRTSRKGSVRKPLSDFGDCFPVENNVALQRWMESNSVYEYEEHLSNLDYHPQSVADVSTIDGSQDDSDSDVELESEMTHALLISGKQKLAHGYEQEAERLLTFCLKKLTVLRSSEARPGTPNQAMQSAEAVEKLLEIYIGRSDWPNAQAVVEQGMSIKARLIGRHGTTYLGDLLQLAGLLQRKGDYQAAQIQARKALKGYKKLRPSHNGVVESLTLLIELAQASGQEDDAEAFAIMLTEVKATRSDGHFVEHLDERRIDVPARPPPPPPRMMYSVRSPASNHSLQGSVVESVASSGSSLPAQSSISSDAPSTANTLDTPATSTIATSQPEEHDLGIATEATSDVNHSCRYPAINAAGLGIVADAIIDTHKMTLQESTCDIDHSEVIPDIGESGVEQDDESVPEDKGKEEPSAGADLHKHDSMFQSPNADTALNVYDVDTDADHETKTVITDSANVLQTNTQQVKAQPYQAYVEPDQESDARVPPKPLESVSVPVPLITTTADDDRASDGSILQAVMQAASDINSEAAHDQASAPLDGSAFGGLGQIAEPASDKEVFFDAPEESSVPATQLPDDVEGMMNVEQERLSFSAKSPTSTEPMPTINVEQHIEASTRTSGETIRKTRPRKLTDAEKDTWTTTSSGLAANMMLLESKLDPTYRKRVEATERMISAERDNWATTRNAIVGNPNASNTKQRPTLHLQTQSSVETIRNYSLPYTLNSSDIIQDTLPDSSRSTLNAETLAQLSRQTNPGATPRTSNEVSSIISVAGSVRGPHPSVRGRFKTRNVAVVGESYVGKSALIGRFQSGAMPTQLSITIMPDPTKVKNTDHNVHMDFRDTCGLMEYERLRQLAYRGAQVVILCFSLDMPDSLANIEYVWADEIARSCPGRPIILVGTKEDLVDNVAVKEELAKCGQHPVKREEAMEMCKKIGALKYLQCSASSGNGVAEVFEAAVTTVVRQPTFRQPTAKKSKIWNLRRFSKNDLLVEE